MTSPAPYSAFEVAGVSEPLTTSGSNSLLFDGDKTLFFALDFWSFLINQYVGARLLQEARAANILGVKQAVAQRYPWPPDLEFQSNQFQFPLLAVYRKTSTYTRKTASWEHDRGTFDLFYALPPLTAGQTESLYPILRAIELLIREKTTQAWDPAYTPPGGNLGDQFDSAPYANVEEIGWERGSYGTMPGAGNLRFPFLLMEGYVLERDIYVPGQKFAGVDVNTTLVASDLTTIPNFMELATQRAPTITSLSVTSGPIAGGTSVTITGTLFLSSPLVTFGVLPAGNIVQVNATTITCTTPAVSGAGTLGVTVVNRDGQSGSLANAFAFS